MIVKVVKDGRVGAVTGYFTIVVAVVDVNIVDVPSFKEAWKVKDDGRQQDGDGVLE
jgi:hypothetical protein